MSKHRMFCHLPGVIMGLSAGPIRTRPSQAISIFALALIFGGLLSRPAAFPARAADAAPTAPRREDHATPISVLASPRLSQPGAPFDDATPVSIEGVVTYYEPRANMLFVQDATAGIRVHPSSNPRLDLAPGDVVRIEGTRRRPGSLRAAAIFQERRLTVVARTNAPLPEPMHPTYNQLAAGLGDGRWIQVEGTLRELWADQYRFEFDLATAGGRLRIHLPRPERMPIPTDLLHARVRVQGACGLELGDRGAIQGVRLFSPSIAHIVRLDAPPLDTDIPARPVSEITLLARADLDAERTRMEGTVTCVVPEGPIYLQNGVSGLEVALFKPRTLSDGEGATEPSREPVMLRPGAWISVVGYPTLRDGRAYLDEASILASSITTVPPPLVPKGPDWTHPRLDACLVEVEGRILKHLPPVPGDPGVARFVVQTDDLILDAQVNSLAPAVPAPGTVIRLRGVAVASQNADRPVRGWRICAPGPEDIRVVRAPLIPLGQSLQRILLVCAGVLVALAGWALLLMRQLGVKRNQNVELEARIASRTLELQETNANLRREVAERSRAGALQAAIYRISEATQSVGDLPELYRQLHEIIGTLMPARNFYIALYDRAADLLTFPYYADEKSGAPESRAWSNGLTEYVIRRREPLLVDQPRIAELTRQGDVHQIGWAAKIWLGVPLIVNGRATGVMAVQDYSDPLALNGNHQRILTYVAGQTATAIERKRAEAALRASQEALRASQQRFRSAFASSPAIMSLSRLRDGVLFEVNDVFLATTGFAREEVIGYSTADLGIWANPEERDTLLRDVREHGSVRNREIAMRQRDGRIRTMLLAAELVEIDREPSILTASLDVTDRLEVESQLRRALTRERELGELKSNFVSLVSHEFRTPLEVILSSAEILERYHQRLAPEQREKQLRAIQKSVRRMADMMNEVLLLGRFEAGRVEFNPAPLDLTAFLRRMRDEITSAMGSEPPIFLHPGPHLEHARGDEGLLGHIFTNLLSHAVKYSPPQAPILFSLRRDARDAVFEVTDKGCGIPAADQRHLFQSFHRGANVGNRAGTGLGLVIVKRCLDRHGGSITFSSLEGAGASFLVRLPLFADAPDPITDSLPASRPSTPHETAALTTSTRHLTPTPSEVPLPLTRIEACPASHTVPAP
ncbi:MAG: GAF domain-containing protein [Verrucomicrobiales bacterium]|nr:GAF domain-containing protein [Verrucomicrobiales bacterium]